MLLRLFHNFHGSSDQLQGVILDAVCLDKNCMQTSGASAAGLTRLALYECTGYSSRAMERLVNKCRSLRAGVLASGSHALFADMVRAFTQTPIELEALALGQTDLIESAPWGACVCVQSEVTVVTA